MDEFVVLEGLDQQGEIDTAGAVGLEDRIAGLMVTRAVRSPISSSPIELTIVKGAVGGATPHALAIGSHCLAISWSRGRLGTRVSARPSQRTRQRQPSRNEKKLCKPHSGMRRRTLTWPRGFFLCSLQPLCC